MLTIQDPQLYKQITYATEAALFGWKQKLHKGTTNNIGDGFS